MEEIQKPKKPKKQKPPKAPKAPRAPKKSLSKKISGVNTTSTISYGNVDVNPKDKRVKWIFGAAIVSLLSIGIGVPIGVAGVQYISDKPYDGDLPVFEGGPTIDDIIGINKDKDKINKNAEKIENIIVEKLYKEEREAFLKFEAFVNNTKYIDTNESVGATSFGVDVSQSFDDVRKSQEKELNKAKKAMRESYPLDWPLKWSQELKSEKYGGSETDQEAIDFLTKNKLKDAAFARFNTAEINITSWTQADLSLQAKQNITYKDDAGVEQSIPAGTRLFSPDLVGGKNFLNANGDNIAIPSQRNPITPSSEVKIAVYQTKSYVLHERNPLNRLPNLYNEYFKSANISSVSIPLIQNAENTELELTITPAMLTNLFTVSRTNSGEQVIPFNTISGFLGANTSSNRQDKDKTILNTILTAAPEPEPEPEPSTKLAATTGSQLGSSKVTSLATLIKSEENELRSFHVAAISAMLTPTPEQGLFKVKNANPIDIFLDKILFMDPTIAAGVSKNITNLTKFLTEELLPEKATDPTAGGETIIFKFKPNFDLFKFNKNLKDKINAINSQDFTNTFNDLLNSSFEDLDPYAGFTDKPTSPVNEVPKKWTVYKIGEDTFLYVDAKGLTVYNIENLTNTTAAPADQPSLKMLQSDIQNTIDVAENPDQVILYDVAAQYNKITTPEIINKILIEENKKYVVDTLKSDTVSEIDATKIVDDVYKNLISTINNTINPDVKSAMTDLSTFIEEMIKPMNSYDFFENPKNSGPITLSFMNNSGYKNAALDGYLLIESEFDDKLREIISVQAKAKPGILPSSRKSGGQ